MRPGPSIHFLTFVLLTLFAASVARTAPTQQVSPSEMSTTAPTPAPSKRLDQDEVRITPVPLRGDEDDDRIRATRVVRNQTWNLSLGLVSGPLKENEPHEQTQIFGLGSTLQLPDEAAQEYTVDVTANGLLGFHAQFKKYCCMGRWNEPYWTAGVGALYDPADLLPGILKLRSYQILGGAGVEDLFRRSRRWRAEVLLGQGESGMSVYLRLGYAFEDNLLNF